MSKRGGGSRASTEVGSRLRSQPPPPWVVFEALTDPDRDPVRPWLRLHDDEVRPEIVEAVRPSRVVWSSLWPRRRDARVAFDIDPDGGGGTALRWTLLVAEPAPDGPMIGHLRKRMNQLINADLRYSFGQ